MSNDVSCFHPALVQAVKYERLRILYGGHSPSAEVWLEAARGLFSPQFVAEAQLMNGVLKDVRRSRGDRRRS